MHGCFHCQVFGRGSKYSLFDPAKEMLFIVMPPEEKATGKAAVDVLGNQVAKSGGSWLMQVRAAAVCAWRRSAHSGSNCCCHIPRSSRAADDCRACLLARRQGALLVCGSMAAAMPFTAAVYVAVCLVWIKATLDLANTMDGPKEEKQVRAAAHRTCMHCGQPPQLVQPQLLTCPAPNPPLLQVLASIDATPLLEPVAPGKVLAPSLAGQQAGLTPEQAAAYVSQHEADVKESMQSKWDD